MSGLIRGKAIDLRNTVAGRLDTIYEMAMSGIIGVDEVCDLFGVPRLTGEARERAEAALEAAREERDLLIQEQTT